MSPEQCRAGRALLGWTQQELARRAKVSLSTVQGFEKGDHRTIPATTEAMRLALEANGIEFIEDGVRLSQTARQRKQRDLVAHVSDLHANMSQAEFEKIVAIILRQRTTPISSTELYDAFYEMGYKLFGSKRKKNFLAKVSRAKKSGILSSDENSKLKLLE
jgi:transcriptional regulator with XRE-family HTH domain